MMTSDFFPSSDEPTNRSGPIELHVPQLQLAFAPPSQLDWLVGLSDVLGLGCPYYSLE